MNRRSFFQGLAAVVGLAALMPVIAQADRRRGGGTSASAAPALVDPKDPQAKAVSYVEKHSDVKDKALMADRSGVKFNDQKCHNCVFYTGAKETTVNGKKAAPCQMPFAANKVVVSEGWCTSWAKKG
ncbi:MAG: high-potential iron-sulfur protein [Pseudobdellovibrio sp.]